MLTTVQPAAAVIAPDAVAPRAAVKVVEGHIDSLHGLRFLAAFSIMFMHASVWVPHLDNGDVINKWPAAFGIVGMPLFFVLSGFVIYFNYKPLFTGYRKRWALTQFFGARFARLVPLYLLMQLIGITLDGMWEWFWTDWNKSVELFVAHATTLTHTWFYIILNNRELMNNGFGISWSIATEWMFYLMFPAIGFMIFGLRSRTMSIVALVVFAVLAQIAFVEIYLWREYFPTWGAQIFPVTLQGSDSVERYLFYYSPWARVFEFILGCLLAHVFIALRNRPPGKIDSFFGAVLLVASLAAVGWTVWLQTVPHTTQITQLLYYMSQRTFGLALILAALIFAVARYKTPVSRFLAWRPLVFLGELSYSIYCLHYFVLRPFFVGQPTVKADTQHIFMGVMAIILGMVATIIFSYGTYKMVESPSRKWLRGVTDRVSVGMFGPKADNVLAEPADRGTRWVVSTLVMLMLAALLIGACAAYQFLVVPKLVPYVTHLN